ELRIEAVAMLHAASQHLARMIGLHLPGSEGCPHVVAGPFGVVDREIALRGEAAAGAMISPPLEDRAVARRPLPGDDPPARWIGIKIRQGFPAFAIEICLATLECLGADVVEVDLAVFLLPFVAA